MTAYILTRLEVRPDRLGDALDLFAEMSRDVAENEPGTTFYAYLVDEARSEVFWCYQEYVDDEARRLHFGRHGHRAPQFEAVLAEPAKASLLSEHPGVQPVSRR
jgi:quinol monooxygenase YgiN